MPIFSHDPDALSFTEGELALFEENIRSGEESAMFDELHQHALDHLCAWADRNDQPSPPLDASED